MNEIPYIDSPPPGDDSTGNKAICNKALDIHIARSVQVTNYPAVTVLVCKRFEFLIRSMNNLKTTRRKMVNQSGNGYSRDNYSEYNTSTVYNNKDNHSFSVNCFGIAVVVNSN